MKLSMITFTEQGYATASLLQEKLGWEDVRLVRKFHRDGSISLQQWCEQQMEERRPLLFIGACGIAVRSIAPFIQDKTKDSPVLVMDEKGQFIIPILAGHLGGGNALAGEIGRLMGATPVITTATDINHKFAVDLFAKENHLLIRNKEGIVQVSARLLRGEKIKIWSDCEIEEIPPYYQDQVELMEGPLLTGADVVISTDNAVLDKGVIQLFPQQYAVGIGCKQGKSEAEIESYLKNQLEGQGLSFQNLFLIASIDRKKQEQGLKELGEKLQLPFQTFSAQELEEVPGVFTASAFVRQTVGVDCVCERAARKAVGKNGRLITGKQADNGITIAIARCEDKLVWKRSKYEE